VNDYLSRLACRAIGQGPVLQPLISARFAPGPPVTPTTAHADVPQEPERPLFPMDPPSGAATVRTRPAARSASGLPRTLTQPETNKSRPPEQPLPRQVVRRTVSTLDIEQSDVPARTESRQAVLPVGEAARSAKAESSAEARAKVTRAMGVPAPRVNENHDPPSARLRPGPDKSDRAEVAFLYRDDVPAHNVRTRSGQSEPQTGPPPMPGELKATTRQHTAVMYGASAVPPVRAARTQPPAGPAPVVDSHLSAVTVRLETPTLGEATLAPVRLRTNEETRASALREHPLPRRTSPAQESTVQVTIGRIEVRAIQPEPARTEPSRPHSPRLSLSDYLRRESERRK